MRWSFEFRTSGAIKFRSQTRSLSPPRGYTYAASARTPSADIMKQKFKTRFDTLMRGFTPTIYMTKLLPMEEVKALHPTMFNRAYTEGNPPIRVPEEHYMGIINLDCLMHCRGGSGGGIAASAFATEAQGATAWVGQQPFALTAGVGESQLFSGSVGQQQSMERQARMVAMVAAQMLRTQMQQDEQQCPGLRLVGKHPAGRPMRSLSDGTCAPSQRAWQLWEMQRQMRTRSTAERGQTNHLATQQAQT